MNINCSYQKLVPLDQLVVHPSNANGHPKRQIDMLAKIISYQGQRAPIVVSKRSGFIVKGHGRLEAIKALAWEKAAVDFQDYEDEAQEFADMVADNKIAELAEHDDELMKLGALELDLDKNGFDLDLLGIPDLDLSVPDPSKEAIEDDVPEPTKSVSVLGDIYELGEHRLMCGDSTSIDAVEKLMNGAKADMVFTDPPYGIAYDGKGQDGLAKGNDFGPIMGDKSLDAAKSAFVLAKDFALNRGVWFGANNYTSILPDGSVWLVWDKEVIGDRHNHCELAWVDSPRGIIRKFKHQWHGFIKASEMGEAKVHPTQKPIALAEWCFDVYGPEIRTESVLDLFGGSGSTLIACEKTNRKCFMMELDPHYVDVIVSRYVKYSGKASIKRNGEPMEWTI